MQAQKSLPGEMNKPQIGTDVD